MSAEAVSAAVPAARFLLPLLIIRHLPVHEVPHGRPAPPAIPAVAPAPE